MHLIIRDLFLYSGFLWISVVRGEIDLVKQVILNPGDKTETILTPADFKTIDDVTKELNLENLGFKTDEDQQVNRFEGDIKLPKDLSIHGFINGSNDLGRAAVRERWRKWPNGEIPYLISNEYGAYSRRLIAKAFDDYHAKTCLRFVPRESNKHADYIFINPEDGCYSFVGRSGGRQPVSLDGGCMQLGTIIHELMHAAGHFHEQSRSDRDDFVEVQWSNVRDGAVDQFEKYSLRTLTQLDLPYDYESIMHYGPKTFSRNGRPTLKPLKSGSGSMGQRRGFSRLDLMKLNKLYDCPMASIPEPDWPGDPNAGSGNTDESPGFGQRVVDWFTGLIRSKPKVPVCKNFKWHCFFWKWIGYCKTHREYMAENCPKKCDFCDGQEGVPNKINSMPKSCSDLHSHCNEWSKMDYCKEDQYSQYMKENCAKTCQFCSTNNNSTLHQKDQSPAGSIIDKNLGEREECGNKLSQSACDQYAFWGLCAGQPDYMAENCRKSCRLCN